MKKGDTVNFKGRQGVIVNFMPHGMVDVVFEDAPRRQERRKATDLSVIPRARSNPAGSDEQEFPPPNQRDLEAADSWANKIIEDARREYNVLVRQGRGSERRARSAARTVEALSELTPEQRYFRMMRGREMKRLPKMEVKSAAKEKTAQRPLFSPELGPLLDDFVPSTKGETAKSLIARLKGIRSPVYPVPESRKGWVLPEPLHFGAIPSEELREFLAQNYNLYYYSPNRDLDVLNPVEEERERRLRRDRPLPDEGRAELTELMKKTLPDSVFEDVQARVKALSGEPYESKITPREISRLLSDERANTSHHLRSLSDLQRAESLDERMRVARLGAADEAQWTKLRDKTTKPEEVELILDSLDYSKSPFGTKASGFTSAPFVEREYLGTLRSSFEKQQRELAGYLKQYKFFSSFKGTREEANEAWKKREKEKQAQRRTEKAAKATPPADEATLGAERVADELRRREQEAAKKAEAAKRRKQIEAEIERLRKPLPSSEKSAVTSIADEIGYTGAGYFARKDEPRLSGDKTDYCGNPIDGTAYYVVIDNRARSTVRFITWQDVIRQAKEDGKTLKQLVRKGITSSPRSAQALFVEQMNGIYRGLDKSLSDSKQQLSQQKAELEKIYYRKKIFLGTKKRILEAVAADGRPPMFHIKSLLLGAKSRRAEPLVVEALTHFCFQSSYLHHESGGGRCSSDEAAYC